ncbi:MAG TPA: hypothetical protein VH370_14580 [Humisphaera sp.]|nr:hypothetical protein [Humisphaera sp.]
MIAFTQNLLTRSGQPNLANGAAALCLLSRFSRLSSDNSLALGHYLDTRASTG